MLFLLEDTLEGCTSLNPFLHMHCYDNITILAGSLGLDHDIVAITNMILDHRTAAYNQSIAIFAIDQIHIHTECCHGMEKDIRRPPGAETTLSSTTPGLIAKF